MGEEITARGGYEDSDVTNYKRKFIERIAGTQSISYIQSEVNFGEPGNNRSLDIAVPIRPRAQSSSDSIEGVTLDRIRRTTSHPTSLRMAIDPEFPSAQSTC